MSFSFIVTTVPRRAAGPELCCGPLWARRGCRRGRPRRGFTFLELLIVVGLAGLLIAGIFTMLLATMRVTEQARSQPFFHEHVDSVARFLDASLARAAQSEGGRPAWGQPPSQRGGDRWLQWEITRPHPLFRVEEEPFPVSRATVWLVYDGTVGLMLTWQSPEITERNDSETRNTTLSPWCVGLTYHVYDAANDEWEVQAVGDLGSRSGSDLPTLLELNFRAPDGREATRWVMLPPTSLSPTPF